MQSAELVALPLNERLMAMEALWESLCHNSGQGLPVPDWHKEELSQRIAAMDAGLETVSPWEDAKVNIRQRAHALTGAA